MSINAEEIMELLETIAQSHEIEKLVKESDDYTIIVSPYLKINNRLRPKLTECFNRNNYNLILYRENELTKEENKWLTGFSNIILLPIKNLHAKCYLNERTAIVTSMNLYDYSQINNHEIGIKLTVDDNEKEIIQLLYFINTIIKTDHPNFNFSDFNVERKEHTMGALYTELIENYEFPKRKSGIDGVYLFMCDIARKLYKFEETDLKFDKAALKRSTELDSKKYFNLKSELIKQAVKREHHPENKSNSIETKGFNEESTKTNPNNEYDYTQFSLAWYKYLMKTFPNKKFIIEDNIITANKFPFENTEFSNRYGFVSISFNNDYNIMKGLKDQYYGKIINSLKDYRLYWSPADKINLYGSKNKSFKSIQEDIEYCAEGLNLLIKEIKFLSF